MHADESVERGELQAAAFRLFENRIATDGQGRSAPMLKGDDNVHT